MRLLAIASLAVGLACELTSATSLLHAPRSLHLRHEHLGERIRREAFEIIDTQLHRRQEASQSAAAAAPSASSSSGIPNLNDPNTSTAITTACYDAFANITKVSNAAGWAACYNILYLNNQTGIFEADLRLYQVSQPSGTFAGIQPANINLALSYPEAAISATNQQAERRDLTPRQSSNTMNELQQYSFVGQINKRLILTQLKPTDLMSLVIPSISLYAQSPQTNAMVSTNMTSASIAYFATGVFAGQGASAAAAAQPMAITLAAQKAAAFTIPGKTFGIFPIGGIVTWSWIFLFVTAFGLGTIGRIVSRREYRAHRSTAAPTPVETAKDDSVPVLRRLMSRKVSSSKRPAKGSAPTRKESKSRKKGALAPAVEMVNYEITYDKTFGERPNYYLDHLPSYRAVNRPL